MDKKDIFVKIKEVEKINLKPGDVLLIKLIEETSHSDASCILKNMVKLFPNNKVVVFIGDVKFQAVEQQEV